MDVLILSWFIGSLGYQAVVYGYGLRWYQARQMMLEEEEVILNPEPQDYTTQNDANEPIQSKVLPDAEQEAGFAPIPTIASSADSSSSEVYDSIQDPRLTGWEYKIVRASWDMFHNTGVLQQLCEEESQAGWIMLEKLDDRRIRFKRPIALRHIMATHQLAIDPYRSHYGSPLNLASWLGMVAAITAIVLPAYLGYALVFRNTHQQRSRPVPAPSTWSPSELPSPSLP